MTKFQEWEVDDWHFCHVGMGLMTAVFFLTALFRLVTL